MRNSPAFQYYPSDLLSDPEVMFWDMREVGAYWILISYLWVNGGVAEDSDKFRRKLFRVRYDRVSREIWATIQSKFIVENGIVTHKRVSREMKKQQEIRVKKQKAAKSRWEDACENDAGADAGASEMHNQTQCPSSSSSTSVYNTPLNPPTPDEIREHWNGQKTLTMIREMTEGRVRKLRVRNKEPAFCENWKLIITLLSKSKFHTGDNKSNWKVNVDWLLRDDKNYMGILERENDILQQHAQQSPYEFQEPTEDLIRFIEGKK